MNNKILFNGKYHSLNNIVKQFNKDEKKIDNEYLEQINNGGGIFDNIIKSKDV